MQMSVANETITVIIPDHCEVAIGTMMSVIWQSKLPREVFEV